MELNIEHFRKCYSLSGGSRIVYEKTGCGQRGNVKPESVSLRSRILGFLNYGSHHGTMEDWGKNVEIKKIFYEALVEKYGESNVLRAFGKPRFVFTGHEEVDGWKKSSRPLTARDVKRLEVGARGFKEKMESEANKALGEYLSLLEKMAGSRFMKQDQVRKEAESVLRRNPGYGINRLSRDDIDSLVWREIEKYFPVKMAVRRQLDPRLGEAMLHAGHAGRHDAGPFIELDDVSPRSVLARLQGKLAGYAISK